jgi:D-alanyl-D-alanine carboxypeptidase/D-alanyl-D-alanine-endopeptidase (penicillin-binding protein 4)
MIGTDRAHPLPRRAARAGALALLPLALACASSPRAVAPTRPSLPAVVESIAGRPPLDRTHWGIEVYDPAAGRVLFARDPEKHFVPASNTKLVVTTVALGELGPDFRYRTEIYALGGTGGTGGTGRNGGGRGSAGAGASARTGSIGAAGDSVIGGLLVVGRGDPTLSARFHGGELAALDSLADSLAVAGVRRVAGDLVVDASYFDDEWIHSTWEVGDLPWSYATPVAAFAVAEGTFLLVVEPGAAPGEPARVTVLGPERAVAVRSEALTDTAGAGNSLEIVRRPGSDTLVVTGGVPYLAAPDTLRLAVTDPAGYAARALEAALEARGIAVDGAVRVVYDTAEAVALRAAAGAEPLVTWTSPPLTEIVAAILQPSQNWIAEQLLKTLGAERGKRGSWREGLDVERRYLFDVVGVDSGAVALRDGSGLSAQNLLTPHAIVQILDHARRQPWGDAYVAAMAQPGVKESTLERRLTGLEGRVFAKTGTIAHVNSLSGYLRTANGRELIFSILSNASGRPAGEVRRAIDRIVSTLAEEGVRYDAW